MSEGITCFVILTEQRLISFSFLPTKPVIGSLVSYTRSSDLKTTNTTENHVLDLINLTDVTLKDHFCSFFAWITLTTIRFIASFARLETDKLVCDNQINHEAK